MFIRGSWHIGRQQGVLGPKADVVARNFPVGFRGAQPPQVRSVYNMFMVTGDFANIIDIKIAVRRSSAYFLAGCEVASALRAGAVPETVI